MDESGLSERPTRARTWAPRGQTPVLQYHFNWKQLSVIAGISLWRFYFRLFPGAIQLEFLPAYAPELNPTEYIWGYLKEHALPNFCAHDLAHLCVTARQRLRSMQRRPKLIAAFWKQAELPL